MTTALERKIVVSDHEMDLDEDGFLQRPELWDSALATALAQMDDISELTEAHWKIIDYIRASFHEHGVVPAIRAVCADSRLSVRGFYELFPAGLIRGACRIAGLPKPAGCV